MVPEGEVEVSEVEGLRSPPLLLELPPVLEAVELELKPVLA